MAAREQRSEIRLNAGTDQAEHAEASTEQLRVQDGEYLLEGGLSKRFGFTVDTTVVGTEHPRALLSHGSGGYGVLRKRDFVLARPGFGVSTSQHVDAYTWHGNVRVAAAQPASVSGGAVASWSECDGAVLVSGGRTLVAMVTASVQIRAEYTITDVATGVLIHSGSLHATNHSMPRIVAQNGKFIIYYVEVSSGDVRRRVLDVTVNPVTETDAALIATTVTAGPATFDAYARPDVDRAILAWVSGTDIVVARVDSSGSTLATLTVAHGGGTPTVGVVEARDGSVHLVEGRSASNPYRVWRYAADLSSRTHTSTPTGQSNTVHVRVGIACTPDVGDSTVVAVVEGTDTHVQWAILPIDHSSVPATALVKQHVMLSKPFVEYSTASTNRDATEAVYAVVLGRAEAVAGNGALRPAAAVRLTTHAMSHPLPMAMLADECFEFAPAGNAGNMMPTVTAVVGLDSKDEATFDWYIPQLYLTDAPKGETMAALSENARIYGARVVKLEHAMNDTLPRAEGVVGGSLVRAFGGGRGSFGEVAPLVHPNLTLADNGAGAMGVGTYAYYGVMVHYSDDGRVRRSAPSIVASITQVASRQVLVTYNTKLTTQLTAGWQLELYRTAAGGSEPQLLTTFPITPGDSGTYADNATDASIADNKLLYTLGELQNECPPPASALTWHRERVFGVSGLDRRTVFFSKVVREGFFPEFNAALRFRLASNENIIALASLDDKLLLFTDANVYAVLGDGPDANGVGAFEVPEPVATGLAITGPYNLAVLPMGVLLHTAAGMHVLGRDLQVTDVSGPTRTEWAAPNGLTPAKAVHIPALKRVYWLYASLSAAVYVFDYTHGTGRWVKHGCKAFSSGLRFLDCADVAGTPYFLTTRSSSVDCPVLYRDVSAYDDEGTYVGLQVSVNAWRPVRDVEHRPGLLDEVRLRRFHVVTHAGVAGSFNDSLKLELTNARQPRSFNTSLTETFTWTSTQLLDGVYGHVNVRPRYQRVNALSWTATTLEGASANSQGPVIIGFIIDWATTGRTARRHGLNPT